MSTGGTSVDVTDIVHPDNQALAVRAAAVTGLDVAGIDLIIKDISRSYMEIGGAICEVNYCPGFHAHWVAQGKQRDMLTPFIRYLFPEGSPCRIPTAAITGTNGKTTTALMLSHTLKRAGHFVGTTTTNGLYIDGRHIMKGDLASRGGARRLLLDPQIDAAVLEYARGRLIRFGMDQAGCDIGIVLNVEEDHLGFTALIALTR